MKTQWDYQFARPSEETPWVAFGHIDDVSYHTPPKPYSKGEWLLLECNVDWSCDYWTLPGRGLELGEPNRALGRDLEGHLLSVRWPAGEITKSWIGMDTVDLPKGQYLGGPSMSPIYWIGVNIQGIGIKVNIKDLQFDKEEIEALPFMSGQIFGLPPRASELADLGIDTKTSA